MIDFFQKILKKKEISDEEYFKEIKEIDQQYKEIVEKFKGSFPRPLNSITERETFFKKFDKNEKYNPQIKYETRTYDPTIIEKLDNFKINLKNDKYGFKKLYEKKIHFKKNQFYCFEHWGEPKSTKYAEIYWGKPNYLTYLKAKKFCKNFKRQKVKFTKITLDELEKGLKDEVKRLTGEELKVEYKVLPNKITINPQKKRITINPDERYTNLDFKRLITHEIGVHYMRCYNGRQRGFGILKDGTSNVTETEEGLAAYTEELKGVASKAQMYIYAGRVIASYYAPKKSFYEIFKILKKYNFKNSDAYTLTLRAKRNICDTSQKGGFTKDFVYFAGYLKVKKYAKKYNIRDLFIGKVKIDDLKDKRLRKYIKINRDKIKTIFDE